MSYTNTTTGSEIADLFASQITGKTFVITGPSNGSIGAQTALDFAAHNPARIILLGRSESKVSPVLAAIAALAPSVQTKFVQVDLADLASVRAAAEQIPTGVDVLVNNAGVMALKTYTKTFDGFEAQFGVNFLAHFLLANLLLQQGKLERGSRVVNVTSAAANMEGFREDDWNFSDGETYHPWLAYCQSKAANILFTSSLAEKAKARGVLSFSAHPGLINTTGLADDVSAESFAEAWKLGTERNGGVPPIEVVKSLAAGSATSVRAALDPTLEDESGAYMKDATVVPRESMKEHLTDTDAAAKLWALAEELVSVKVDF